jgi:hypothetical protein
VSKLFPSNHPAKGKETLFKTKILNYSKIHTIRKNYKYWEKRLSAVNEEKGYLSLRQWKAQPYYSKSEEFKILYKVGFERVRKFNDIWFVGKERLIVNDEVISENDGLNINDFNNWFPMDTYIDMIIIHFTKFRYSQQTIEEEKLTNDQRIANQQLTLKF